MTHQPLKGRALRRALATADAHRVGGPVEIPLIVDTTELITPEVAQDLLNKNYSNRPIDWKRVDEYAVVMRRGEWQLHAQGLVLDSDGHLLTGQKRLWAVLRSGTAVYMRVSRGNPPRVARLLDRGTPQSARDLAARGTGRKHLPIEASLARAMLALRGDLRPSLDTLADTIEAHAALVSTLLDKTAGTKKTRGVLMILAAIAATAPNLAVATATTLHTEELAARLDADLAPLDCARCWAKGAAFRLAMEKARLLVAR